MGGEGQTEACHVAGGGAALLAVFTASHAPLPVDVGGLACRAWGGGRSLAWVQRESRGNVPGSSLAGSPAF